jgi:hypothetical protein
VKASRVSLSACREEGGPAGSLADIGTDLPDAGAVILGFSATE